MTDVDAIYHGSDGEATKALYLELESLGKAGIVAVNLFRACKCSERAKVYRGGIRGQGSFRRMAYDRKQWSIGNLCTMLEEHAAGLGIGWGWKTDPATINYEWVLYVDLPSGQVSFHAASRGTGPDYAREWDGIKGASAARVVEYCRRLLDPATRKAATAADQKSDQGATPKVEVKASHAEIAVGSYHRGRYEHCRFCHGKGCAACDAEYRRACGSENYATAPAGL